MFGDLAGEEFETDMIKFGMGHATAVRGKILESRAKFGSKKDYTGLLRPKNVVKQ